MPLDKNYKDPFKKGSSPATPIPVPGTPPAMIGKPIIAPAVADQTPTNNLAAASSPAPIPTVPNDSVEPQSFSLSDVPLFTDATGKKQVDYSALAERMYKNKAGEYDSNKVSRQDLDDSQDRASANTIIAGLSKASAEVGGTKSTVGDTANALNSEDKINIANREHLASAGYEGANKALDEMQAAPLKMQNADQLLKSTDPTSAISQFSRQYYQSLMGGQPLPQNMTASDIGKFSPDIVKVATEQLQKQFQSEMFGKEKDFQTKQAQKQYYQQQQLMKQELKNKSALEAQGFEQNLAMQAAAPSKILDKPVNVNAVKIGQAASALEGAHKTVEGIEAGGKSIFSDPLNVAGHYLPNALKSEDLQRVENAERQFAVAAWNAAGRKGAPSKENIEASIKQYFPQPGDSQGVIQQKKLSREGLIKGSKNTAELSMYGRGGDAGSEVPNE